MLDRLDRVEVEGAARRIRFAFPAPPRTGRHVVQLRGIHKAYGAEGRVRGGRPRRRAGRPHRARRAERRGQIDAPPDPRRRRCRPNTGERVLGAHVTTHYYAQHQLDALDPARTVLEEMEAAAPDADRTRLRTLLGAFLFSGDAVDKRVAVLSGGEKARLALARMLVRPAPFLCLDEPTNHLDLASRGTCSRTPLAGFPGTMVFISHDRYFINRLATKVVEVRDGRLVTHLGGYDDYRAALARPEAAATAPAPEERARPVGVAGPRTRARGAGAAADAAARPRRRAARRSGRARAPAAARCPRGPDPRARGSAGGARRGPRRSRPLRRRRARPRGHPRAADRPKSRSPGCSTSGRRSPRRWPRMSDGAPGGDG